MKQARAYIRGIPRLPPEDQRRRITAWAAENGYDVKIYEETGTGKVRELFSRELRRNDLAILDNLAALGRTREELNGSLCSDDFNATMTAISSRCGDIIELESGARRDGPYNYWVERIAKALGRVRYGRLLPPDLASKMGQTSAAKRRNVKKHWHSPEMADELERWQQHWRDTTRFTSAKIAFNKLPKRLQEEFRNVRFARSVLGVRKPDGSGGGRPPKQFST